MHGQACRLRGRNAQWMQSGWRYCGSATTRRCNARAVLNGVSDISDISGCLGKCDLVGRVVDCLIKLILLLFLYNLDTCFSKRFEHSRNKPILSHCLSLYHTYICRRILDLWTCTQCSIPLSIPVSYMHAYRRTPRTASRVARASTTTTGRPIPYRYVVCALRVRLWSGWRARLTWGFLQLK